MSREDEEEIEDVEMDRAIASLAKSVKQIKKKNWERYKNIFPDLYAEEFGIDRSIDPQIQKIVEKERDKISKIQEKADDIKVENMRLKKHIKELEKMNRKKDRDIEKMNKDIKKRDEEIMRLSRVKKDGQI